jgi:hypothetical protein
MVKFSFGASKKRRLSPSRQGVVSTGGRSRWGRINNSVEGRIRTQKLLVGMKKNSVGGRSTVVIISPMSYGTIGDVMGYRYEIPVAYLLLMPNVSRRLCYLAMVTVFYFCLLSLSQIVRTSEIIL